jgi:hypothetical protein
MAREFYREGMLQLTIEFAVEHQGWILDLASGPDPDHLVHSQIILPLAAYEQGNVDEYLDALLAIHFDHLGLLYTGW